MSHSQRFPGGCGPPLMLAIAVLCLPLTQGAPQKEAPQQPSSQLPPRPWTPNDSNPSYSSGGLCAQPAQPAQASLNSDEPAFTCLAASDPNAVNILHSAERNFSVDFLRHMARHNGGGNVFVSPYSVYEALLLSFFTSAGHTEASLRKILHIPDNMAKIDVLGAHSCIQKVLNSQRAEQLRSVNKIYLDQKLQPVNCVKNTLENDIESISFQNPGVTDTINAWVAQQTNNKISQLLLPNSVSADTKLVLANAVYFKDLWLSQFTPEKTKKEVFFLDTHPIKSTFTHMMKQKGSFKVQKSAYMAAMVLELPYKNTNISMLILLPPPAQNAEAAEAKKSDDLQGVDDVLVKFSAEELTRLLDNDVTPKQVEVAVPKWSASQSIELVQTLEAMGVGDLFQPTANLTDLTGQPGITFDSVVHKAKIDVDEAGTEAAGATAIFSFRSSRPLQPESFICNHPFVYLIVDKTSKTVLFAGIYRSPTS